MFLGVLITKMPKLIPSGRTVHTRHANTPCGKLYTGKIRKVNMLIKMHTKVCLKCKNAESAKRIKISTNQSFDNKSFVRRYLEGLQQEGKRVPIEF